MPPSPLRLESLHLSGDVLHLNSSPFSSSTPVLPSIPKRPPRTCTSPGWRLHRGVRSGLQTEKYSAVQPDTTLFQMYSPRFCLALLPIICPGGRQYQHYDRYQYASWCPVALQTLRSVESHAPDEGSPTTNIHSQTSSTRLRPMPSRPRHGAHSPRFRAQIRPQKESSRLKPVCAIICPDNSLLSVKKKLFHHPQNSLQNGVDPAIITSCYIYGSQ